MIGQLGWRLAAAKDVSAVAPGDPYYCRHQLKTAALPPSSRLDSRLSPFAEAGRAACLQLLKWRRLCGVGTKDEATPIEA